MGTKRTSEAATDSPHDLLLSHKRVDRHLRGGLAKQVTPTLEECPVENSSNIASENNEQNIVKASENNEQNIVKASENVEQSKENEETQKSKVEETFKRNTTANTIYKSHLNQKLESQLAREASGKMASEAGILDSILLQNFMCHQYLKVAFGPHMNFVVGHNGSGKSAILTAMTVCLGGKALHTSRGMNLKAFIREGESVAEVTLMMKNKGAKAYQPEQYGSFIQITRRIAMDNTSSYKIKSETGRVVATKREELTRICDHFGIQPDNPMLILNQDAAREFLMSSTDADRYKFFLRGTQLAQIWSDLKQVEVNLQRISETIQKKRSALMDLKRTAQQHLRQVKKLEEHMSIEQRIAQLKAQLEWSMIYDQEDNLQGTKNEAHVLERKAMVAQEKHSTLLASLSQLNAQILEILPRLDQLSKEKSERNMELTMQRNRKPNIMTALENEFNQLSKQIQTIQNQLKVNQNADASKHSKYVNELKQLKDALSEVNVDKTPLMDCEATLQEISFKHGSLSREVKRVKEQIDMLNKGKHPASRFGPACVQVLERLSQLPFSISPLGPLGMKMQLKNKEWSKVLDAVIPRRFAMSFVVQTVADQKQLKKLFDACRYPGDIYLAQVDESFDCSEGMPDQSLTTLLSVLQFENELTRQLVINMFHVESIIIVHSRMQGEALLSPWPKGVSACYDKEANKIGNKGGGYSNFASTVLQNGIYSLMHNPLNEYLKQEASLSQEYSILDQQKIQLEREYQEKHHSWSKQKQRETQLRERIAFLNDALMEYDDSMDNLQQDLLTNKLSLLSSQLEGVKERIKGEEAEAENNLQQLNDQMQSISRELDTLHTQLGSLEKQKCKYEAEAKHYLTSIDRYSQEAQVKQTLVVQLESSLLEAKERAEGRFGSENIVHRSELQKVTTDTLLRQIKDEEAALAVCESRSSLSREQVMDQYEESRRIYEETVKNVQCLLRIQQVLSHAHAQRMEQSREFQSALATRTSMLFVTLLRRRNYIGRLIFDHDAQRLYLTVSTNTSTESQSQSKNIRSLSGGEKSFSTICLLLALWESMASPIRALDEFDVFMDSVNRRVAVATLVEMARADTRFQYILITPQGVDAMQVDPRFVRITRLLDPVRNQSVIQ